MSKNARNRHFALASAVIAGLAISWASGQAARSAVGDPAGEPPSRAQGGGAALPGVAKDAQARLPAVAGGPRVTPGRRP